MKNPLQPSTEETLRAPLPDTTPRPGFETRLLAQLRDAPHRQSRRTLALSLATATTLLVALLVSLPLLNQQPGTRGASADPVPVNPEPRPVLELQALPNPLREQTTALTERATRTSRFLINCLPSLPETESQL